MNYTLETANRLARATGLNVHDYEQSNVNGNIISRYIVHDDDWTLFDIFMSIEEVIHYLDDRLEWISTRDDDEGYIHHDDEEYINRITEQLNDYVQHIVELAYKEIDDVVINDVIDTQNRIEDIIRQLKSVINGG